MRVTRGIRFGARGASPCNYENVKSLLFGCALLCATLPAFSQGSAERIASRVQTENLKADVAFLASDALQGRG
jgi:hypothetical protein